MAQELWKTKLLLLLLIPLLDPRPPGAEKSPSTTHTPSNPTEGQKQRGSPGKRDVRDKEDRNEPQTRVQIKLQAERGRLKDIHTCCQGACVSSVTFLFQALSPLWSCETGVMVAL